MNLQDGDNNLNRGYYEIILNYVKQGQSLLNLGCGIFFNFEKFLYKKKNIKPVCVDIIDISKLGLQKPDCIDDFLIKSVEDEFILENKFDVVTFFEVIEHIDKTDILLKNCFNNLKDDGMLIFSFPNLASIYSRIELMFGFQPHILEISNEQANLGTGILGKLNNPNNKPIHHIRGITNKAMKEMVGFHGFRIEKMFGHSNKFKNSNIFNKIFYYMPSLAPANIFVCRKK